MKNSFIEYADSATLSSFALKHSLELHSGAIAPELDFDKKEGNLLVTAGKDRTVVVFNASTGKIENSLKLGRTPTGALFCPVLDTDDSTHAIVVTDEKGGLHIMNFSSKN